MKGTKSRNRGWVLIPLVAVVVIAASVGYARFMGFETITYELRECDQSLSEESTWAQVEAAGCEPVDADGTQVELFHEGSYAAPDDVSASTYTFEDWPVNSPSHGISVRTTEPTGSIVVAEPTNEAIRDELNGDAADTVWSGFIGSRGPTTYWILLSP